MGRLICLDYGRKRVGVAVTDPLQIIAKGLETVSTGEIRTYMEAYLKREEVDAVVVGYPRTLRNKSSDAVQFIDPFLRWFRQRFPHVPVVLYDERFTSRMAERSLIESGVPRMARRDKSLVDTVSAALILQSYLDALKNEREAIR